MHALFIKTKNKTYNRNIPNAYKTIFSIEKITYSLFFHDKSSINKYIKYPIPPMIPTITASSIIITITFARVGRMIDKANKRKIIRITKNNIFPPPYHVPL